MKQVDFLFLWWNHAVMKSNTIRSHPAADAQRTKALAEKTHLVTVKIHLWHQADSRGHNQHNESQISNKTLITIHIDIHRYMMLYDVIWCYMMLYDVIRISIKMTYSIWLWYWHYLLEIWPTMTHNTHHLLLGINRLWGDKGLRCRRPSSPRHLHGYRM